MQQLTIIIKSTQPHSRNYILRILNPYATWISSRLNEANFIYPGERLADILNIYFA